MAFASFSLLPKVARRVNFFVALSPAGGWLWYLSLVSREVPWFQWAEVALLCDRGSGLEPLFPAKCCGSNATVQHETPPCVGHPVLTRCGAL